MSKFEDKTREIAAMAAANEARDRSLRGVAAQDAPRPAKADRRTDGRRLGVYLRFDSERSRVLDVVSRALGMSPTAFAMRCVEETLDELSGLPEVNAAIAASGDGLEDAIVSRLERGGR
ncbi:MAG: hypothetical protein MR874_01235 [Coriobacteriaceae bacterium]|nr:hypothetical protein [Coriobacteriaceae bacterium]MCI6843371.1 hypothetical protein [Coriobacteriaceae bacterium]